MTFIKSLIILFLALGVGGCSSSAPTPKTPDEMPTTVETTSIDEQVIYKSEDLKLTATSLEIKDTTSVLNLHAESFTETTLQIEIYISSINGFAIDPVTNLFNLNFLCKEDYRVSFFNEDLLTHHIGQITEIDFVLNIFELDDEFEVMTSTTVHPSSIKTNHYQSYVTPYDATGSVVYDHQDLRVILKEVTEGEITFYFENNSKHSLSIVYKINESGVSSSNASVVNMGANKKAIRKLSITNNDLSQLELYLGIEDLDTSHLLDSTTIPLKKEN